MGNATGSRDPASLRYNISGVTSSLPILLDLVRICSAMPEQWTSSNTGSVLGSDQVASVQRQAAADSLCEYPSVERPLRGEGRTASDGLQNAHFFTLEAMDARVLLLPTRLAADGRPDFASKLSLLRDRHAMDLDGSVTPKTGFRRHKQPVGASNASHTVACASVMPFAISALNLFPSRKRTILHNAPRDPTKVAAVLLQFKPTSRLCLRLDAIEQSSLFHQSIKKTLLAYEC